MSMSKRSEVLLKLFRKNVKMALPLQDKVKQKEGLLIKIEFYETNEEKIKMLKEWLLK